MPSLCNETKSKVFQTLTEADSEVFATDDWASSATQSYPAITAHMITIEWETGNFGLQTRSHLEIHSRVNTAEVLKSFVMEPELQRANYGIAVVMDNVRNMDAAVRETGLLPPIKCFAHTLDINRNYWSSHCTS